MLTVAWFQTLTSAIVGLASALLGISITLWFNFARDRKQRRYDLLRLQIEKFYSPMLGIRQEIAMLSTLRVRITSSADREWQELCRRCDDIDEIRGRQECHERLQKERWPEFEAIVEHDNKQFERYMMPAYRKMVEIFRDNMWLADNETRDYFGLLIEFVEIWERYLARALPYEVLTDISHSESRLQEFYSHLQAKHDEIKLMLASGTATAGSPRT